MRQEVGQTTDSSIDEVVPTADGPIEAVVFDIGRVLLRYDPRLLFNQLLPDEAAVATFLDEVCSHDWNFQQDLGRGWDEAIALLIAEHPDKASLIRAFRARWHEMVPGEIAGTVAILEELHRNGVALFAITNFAGDTFAETRRRYPFFDLFRDIVVSGIERVAKPDPRIFELAAKRFAIMPQRALFIDDTMEHVLAARSVGFNAVQFTSPEQLRRDLIARRLPLD